MKINPRVRAIALATTKFRLLVHELAEEHDLSTSELMLILTETTCKLFNSLVKEEHQSEE